MKIVGIRNFPALTAPLIDYISLAQTLTANESQNPYSSQEYVLCNEQYRKSSFVCCT